MAHEILKFQNGMPMNCLPKAWEYSQNQNEFSEALFIREIALVDAETAAQLCEQLGYPVSIEAIKKRIATVQTLPNHVVYVSSVSHTVVGWID
ncbi:MAG: hypothetical protein M3Y27_27700, partial [Acidobacteriota bacterium]|nr:hypothetical protein [Acidobacteriota bacterium]